MSLTRADIEAALIDDRGLGHWLADVGLDGSTRDGTNRALLDPIRRALRASGFAVPGWLTVADADLEPVGPGRVEEVLDRAHLAALKLVQGRWTRGDDRPGPTLPGRSEPTPEGRARAYAILLWAIQDLQAELDRKYGDSAGRLAPGVISLEFSAGDDCGEFG